MVAVVREGFARFEVRAFADNTVALNYDAFSGQFGNDPFPAADGNGAIGEVVDGDEINKRVRPFRGGFQVRHVGHVIHVDV
jgi:hypothetical protein